MRSNECFVRILGEVSGKPSPQTFKIPPAIAEVMGVGIPHIFILLDAFLLYWAWTRTEAYSSRGFRSLLLLYSIVFVTFFGGALVIYLLEGFITGAIPFILVGMGLSGLLIYVQVTREYVPDDDYSRLKWKRSTVYSIAAHLAFFLVWLVTESVSPYFA